MTTVTYSKNTEVNVALNKAFHSKWSKGWIFVSYSSLLFLPSLFLLKNTTMEDEIWIVIMIISIWLSIVFTVIPIMIVHKELHKEKIRLLQIEIEPLPIYEEEFWTTWRYCNPYDKRVWVPKRLGIGTTINLGTKVGKIVHYGMMISFVLLMLWVTFMMLPLDFAAIEMKENVESYAIGIWLDQYFLEKEEIKEVFLIQELPKANKQVGAATNRIMTGKFWIKEYGSTTVYVMRNISLYIVVQLKDEKYVLFNGEDVEITQEYYEILNSNIAACN